MADLTPSENIREHDISAIPTPPGPSAAANQASVAFHNLRHDEESKIPSPPSSPIISKQRRRSSVSRVDIGHFDPVGVHELRQTLSRVSQKTQGDDAKKEGTVRSDVTLAVGDGPFDFEKCLRDVVKKYVL